MANSEVIYKEVNEIKSRIKILEKTIEEEREYLEKQQNRYRIERVCEILDVVRSEYRKGNILYLDTILCHCQNKLYGNIDGIDITLDELSIDKKFQKVELLGGGE